MNEEYDLSEIEERLYSQIYHSTCDSTDKRNEQQTEHSKNSNMNRNKRYFNTGINAGINKISVHIDVHNERQSRSGQVRSGQSRSRESNLKGRNHPLPPRNKRMHRVVKNAHLRKLQNVPNYDDINLKEIKAQVDAFPEFIKCIPPHIQKKLKKMNKRILFIQKKKYFDSINKFNRSGRADVKTAIPQSVIPPIAHPVQGVLQDKIIPKREHNSVICLTDDEGKDSKIKSSFIEISSSDEETHVTKSTDKSSAVKHSSQSIAQDVFKRPDDDDVIFIERSSIDVINLENDSESNSSISTKSSVDRFCNKKPRNLETPKHLHKERKELLSTPDSTNSNDFLETTLTDNAPAVFNFELHGTDFEPSKDSARLNAKDVSGSESSCSVAACDLGGLLASNKCALFNEVDFESPSKNIFDESNLESFGNYITPNRSCKKSARNILKTPDLNDEDLEVSLKKKKKKQKEQLPNLSSIVPKATDDLNESVLVVNEMLPSNGKKTKSKKIPKIQATDEVQVIEICRDSSKKKKEKITLQNIGEDAVEVPNVLPKLKKKRKKVFIDEEDTIPAIEKSPDGNLSESQAKKKKKHKKSFSSEHNDGEMDSSVQIIEEKTIHPDVLNISKEDEPKKKKKHRSKLKQNTEYKTVREEISICESIHDDSSEFGEATKKRKSRSKKLITHTEEHSIGTDALEANTETDKIKRKRKRNKSATSDASSIMDSRDIVQSVIEGVASEPKERDKLESDDVDNNAIIVDVKPKSSTPTLPIDTEVVTLDITSSDVQMLSDSVVHVVPADQNSYITISDDDASLSSNSEPDCDFANIIEAQDVQVVNARFKHFKTFDVDDADYIQNILDKMPDDASLWKILPADRYPARSPKYKGRCHRCRDIGHLANQCRKKTMLLCSLCTGRGHLEPRCPNKLCTNCGRRSKFFTTFCSRCAYTKHILCRLCKMKGHEQSMCPDLWRRYHLTITNGPIIRPTERNLSPAKKWCSGCAKQGHLEFQCQYFARDHSPIVPYVIDYNDHLNTRRTPAVSSRSFAITSPPSTPSNSISASNFVTELITEEAKMLPNTLLAEKTSQLLNIDKSQEVMLASSSARVIDTKPLIIKTFLPIPKPIGLNSMESEIKAELSVTSKSPEIAGSAASISTSPFSVKFQISYLYAKHLHFHNVGVSKISSLSARNGTKILIYPDGHISIQASSEAICVSSRTQILNYLKGISQITPPTEKTLLISYLEDILIDLSKESTLQDLRLCVTDLQNASADKTIHIQKLNMMIYGYFKWENGDGQVDKLKNITSTLKGSDNIHDNLLKGVKEYLQYLIEFERPILMYLDIIESIFEGKRNFFNFDSLRIPEEQPPLKKFVLSIDLTKCEYVKNSFSVKFMIFRWRTKLDVSLCYVKSNITLEGRESDVNNAIEEFQMIVGEGSALPRSKWGVRNIILQLFKTIKRLDNTNDNMSGKAIEYLNTPTDVNEMSILKNIHIHLFISRGLNDGHEKMLILQEFVNNFKQTQNDELTDQERKQIQEAMDIVQFNTDRNISEYKLIYENINNMSAEKMFLEMEDYNILKEANEDCVWRENIDLSSIKSITSKHVSISIVGTTNDRQSFKLSILNYIDRVYIFDENPTTLRIKLESSLKMLWTEPFKQSEAEQILNRILAIEIKRIDSHHIDILRKLYQRLHIYLFGCCRLNSLTGLEVPSNNHVDILRVYVAYLGTVNVVPADVQQSIYKAYNYIFGKEKMEGVNYRSLVKDAWIMYKKFKCIDENTTLVIDPRFKNYLIQSSSSLEHSIIAINPIINIVDVQNSLNESFMIVVNNSGEVNCNLPLQIRTESFKLFSDKYSNIASNISSSLHVVDEIGSNFDISKATDFLQYIHTLEKNSPDSKSIEDKYQIMNIYLFGCCYLMDGWRHLNEVKSYHSQFSQPDKGDEYITDCTLMNNLMDSFEYIFWKGKKPKLDYTYLLTQASIVETNTMFTIPLHSNYIYDYFMYVQEGISLRRTVSKNVNVEFSSVYQINKNTALLMLTGRSEALVSSTALFLKAIADIRSFENIPLKMVAFRDYLNSKLNEIIDVESNMIPLTIVHDIESIIQQIDPALSYYEYMKLCSKKELLCYQLNKYIFGVYQTKQFQQQLNAMSTLASKLHLTADMLNLKQIKILHRSLQYLFSSNFKKVTYYKHIKHYERVATYKETITKLRLLPLVYDYLKDMNTSTNSTLSKKLTELKFDKNSPFVSVSGSTSYVSSIRDMFSQYNKVLSKIPKRRQELVIFLNKSVQSVQQRLDDPKPIWKDICLFEQDVSNHLTELRELYVKLHRHLFGCLQLGKGKVLMQVLNQNLTNLTMSNVSFDIISMDMLQEIFFALEYIEGSTRQFSSEEYEDLINETCNPAISVSSDPYNIRSAIKSEQLINSSTTLWISLDQSNHHERYNEQNVSFVSMNSVLKCDQNVCNSDSPLNKSLENICQQPKFGENSTVDPNVSVIENSSDIVEVRTNICVEFSNYLQKIDTGNVLVLKLKRLVQLKIAPTSITLIGSRNNITIAEQLIRANENEKQYKVCYNVRNKIKRALKMLKNCKVMNIKSLLSALSTATSRKKKIVYRSLHSILFGKIKLLSGQYHLDILTTFLNSNYLCSKSELTRINQSFEYIFGTRRKPIDYATVVQSVIYTSRTVLITPNLNHSK